MPLFFLCCFFQLLLPAHHIEDVWRQRDLAGDDIAVEEQHEQLKALIGQRRIRLLRAMGREARELAVLCERYYERGYCRNGKYTL